MQDTERQPLPEQPCGCAQGTPSVRIGTSETFACLGCGVHA